MCDQSSLYVLLFLSRDLQGTRLLNRVLSMRALCWWMMRHKTIDDLIVIMLPGEVVPAPRPRFDSVRKRTYMPKKYRDWQNSVFYHARAEAPEKPVISIFEIKILFLFRRPKSKTTKTNRDFRSPRTGRGDLDNSIKSILDLLQQAKVISDDRLCYKIEAEQWYCTAEEDPRVDIFLSPTKKALWSAKP